MLVVPDGGGTFDLKLIQACSGTSATPGQDFTLVGTKPGGAVVKQTFTTPGHSMDPWTFAPTGFSGLAKLEIELSQVALGSLVFIPHG